MASEVGVAISHIHHVSHVWQQLKDGSAPLEFMYHVMYPPSKVLRQMGNNSFLIVQ